MTSNDLEEYGLLSQTTTSDQNSEIVRPLKEATFSEIFQYFSTHVSFKQALTKHIAAIPPNIKKQKGFTQVVFPACLIVPGETKSVKVFPSARFCGQKIINIRDEKDLYVDEFYVDGVSQYPVSRGPLPLADFKSQPLDSEIRLDVCPKDKPISITITNRGPIPATWQMAILGISVL